MLLVGKTMGSHQLLYGVILTSGQYNNLKFYLKKLLLVTE